MQDRVLPGVALVCGAALLSAFGPLACGPRTIAEANTAQPPPSTAVAGGRQIRATGLIQAVHASTIQVPQIIGQNNRITLVKLIPNGTRVKKGDILAEFDRNLQLE